METQLEIKQGINILTVDGDLDMYNTPILKNSFNSAVQEQTRGIILNLAGVGYLDSSGVGILLYMQNVVTKARIPFVIAGIQEQPFKVLELTKLSNYFPITDSVATGLKKLANGGIRKL